MALLFWIWFQGMTAEQWGLGLVFGSNRDFELASSLCVTNSQYRFCPTLPDVLNISTIEGNIMSWVSKTSRSLVDSWEGFPISVIVVDSDFTCFSNAFCTPFLCSWWQRSGFLPQSPFVTSNEHSNSFTSLATSGPDTIHLRICEVFSVSPAPPSPLTSLLFCLWAWSSDIPEKAWFF